MADADAAKAAGEEQGKAAAAAQAAYTNLMPLALPAPHSPAAGMQASYGGAPPAAGADFGAFQGGSGGGW